MFYSCLFVSGPVVSALTNKYGCRAVCIAGSFIGACAFVLSIFSPTVNMLMLTYGVMGGQSNTVQRKKSTFLDDFLTVIKSLLLK